mgnify:CR=1 FL=1
MIKNHTRQFFTDGKKKNRSGFRKGKKIGGGGIIRERKKVMTEKNRLDEEYCDALKRNSIKHYIIDSNNEFDYVDLADYMGMTFKQLQGYLIKMMERGELYINNGILQIEQDVSYFAFEKEMQDSKEYDIIENITEYIPPNFQKKFRGYT